MKILFLGPIGEGQTSRMRMRALQRLGHDVVGVETVAPWLRASWLTRQIQRRRGRGGVIDEINRAVLDAAAAFKPDIVWGEKQEYLRLVTIWVTHLYNMRGFDRKIDLRTTFSRAAFHLPQPTPAPLSPAAAAH